MSYQLAVNNTPSVSNCYRDGLQALGADSNFVRVSETRDLNGSIDLDSCLRATHRDANRWDYTFGYQNQSYYLEVHPAGTGEVDTVIRKFTWLRNWLQTDGTHFNAIKGHEPFHWVASGKVSIPVGSTYHRRLAGAGLAIPKTTRLIL